MKPMLLTDVGPEVVDEYIDNDAWVMQQKFDGIRVIASHEGGVWTFFSRSGEPVRNAAALKALPEVENALDRFRMYHGMSKVIFDGELVGEHYHIFDLLFTDGAMHLDRDIEPYLPWHTRNTALMDLWTFYPGEFGPLWRAATARSATSKRYMWEDAQREGAEGVVSKRSDSPYRFDTRTDVWVKHKIVHEADVVVCSVDRQYGFSGKVVRGNCELFVCDGAKAGMAHVGNASLIGKDESIDDGDVVTVRYLYMGANGKMVQPRIMHKRVDKHVDECNLDQFTPYSPAVII